ncbi:MAG: tetratricopeptide repeat protein [Longimicrobiales bacterium]|nr:tetratricopeptide repeat protein [Longimicrobiales bacterium]
MNRRGALASGALLLLAGCVYYNALYNAERLYREGEGHRRAGADSLAAARYADVVRKAAKGFREDPDGEWADDALLLMGQAYLRLGELREARAVLEDASRRAEGDEVRLRTLLHLGEAHVIAGDLERGIPLLNQALEGLPSGPLRAEGQLWRGRALLEVGRADVGWWDLDQAATEREVRMEAALTRVLWAIRLGSRDRAQEGMNRLLTFGEAGPRVDSLAVLAHAAAGAWGPAAAAGLLSGADSARWERTPRGMIRLTRASLLREAGDSAGASDLVRRVADGIGPAAADARLELAAWQLGQARDLVEARAALPLLLPALASAEVARRVDDLQEMIAWAERGLSEPLAWFAAGEVARDQLAAPSLARGLFLAYVDAAPSDPWIVKALLAALDVTGDEGDKAWLRGRLEGRGESPYVLAARGEPALGLEGLEEELARRLQRLRTR